jgi:glutamine cyclotransferase
MKHQIVFFFTLILLIASCCNKKTRIKDTAVHTIHETSIATLVLPREGETFKCGDSIRFKFKINPDSLIIIDSAVITNSKNIQNKFYSGFEKMSWNSSPARVGKNILKVIFYKKGRKETHTVSVVLISDIIPFEYKYKVINKFPHDNQAFTQGLLYDDGMLYESTGLEGQSTLRIVTIQTGIPIMKINLENQIFAEGIALFNNQIYQLTYKSQIGFIYDKKTLQLIRRFDYPIKEGWGLTSDGNHLIMSDGSAQLYFIEPTYFSQVDQIEVFDNKGMITYLNELEYINGKVLANIWYKNIIVVIDPANGKVTGKLDLDKLIPHEIKQDPNKVLNGIAWNPLTKHILITGKNWPVLYELEIIPPL